MIAAIYSRKSKFTGKGESVENQIQLCKEYANRMNVSEYLIYEDEGFSGGNTERPSFKKMLNDAKKNKFNILICYRLDRISRNVADFSNTLELLQKYNISFVSIKEQFDTSSPMGRAMVYIASVFAQLERETIAERVKDNMLELAKTGRWLGGNAPLGFESKATSYFDSENKEKTMYTLSPISTEIQLIKLIYDKYLELKSIFKVSKYLDAHSIKLKNYKKANAAYLGELLSNPVYATADNTVYTYFEKHGVIISGSIDGIHGIMPYNRTDGDKKKKDISEWVLAVTTHEGVISGEKWVAVQMLKKKNSQLPPNLGKGNIASLSGLLRCAKCNSPMSVRYGVKRNDGDRAYYYTCSNRIINISNCDNPSVRSDILEAIVIDNLMTLTSNKQLLLKLLASKNKSINNSSINETYKNINDAIAKNETGIKKLVDQIAFSSIDASAFLSQKLEELTKENQKLKKLLLNLENENHKTNIEKIDYELLINALTKFPEAIKNCVTIENRKKLLGYIIERITWDGNHLKINLKSFES